MIIGILGTIGSGKSLSATKLIMENKYPCFTNLNIKSPNTVRIKKEHIIKDVVTGQTKSGKDIVEQKVNWDYWNNALDKHSQYNIVLDEAHNLLSARRGMTKHNILMGIWISQIRKLLGD